MILDDGILDHPKFIRAVARAGSSAIHLWLGMMSWCKQQLTDGVVPVDVVPQLHGPPPRWRSRALEVLIDVGLVERRSERELLVHDFLDWNKSREQVELESAVRRRAAKARRDRQRGRPGVDPTTEREPTDVEVTSEREPTDVVVTTDREQAVSNDNAELSARVPTPIPTHPYPSLSDPDPPSPPAPSETARAEPEPESQSASTSSARRGTNRKPKARSQCPLDLLPDEKTRATAWQLGFSRELLERELADFVDWWRGDGRLKADWQATLRNRLRTVAERRGLKPRKPRDERWLTYQQKLTEANAPVLDAVPPPAGFEQAIGNLFGG